MLFVMLTKSKKVIFTVESTHKIGFAVGLLNNGALHVDYLFIEGKEISIAVVGVKVFAFRYARKWVIGADIRMSFLDNLVTGIDL